MRALHWYSCIITLVISSAAVPFAPAQQSAHWWSEAAANALEGAAANRPQILKALETVPEAQRRGMAFLVENMPAEDLQSLTADFLLDNVTLGYEALEMAPWSKQISEDLFLNDVLPYASITENRENWRGKLREIALPLVKDARTPGDAGQILNKELFKLVKVKYSTKRRAADQGPLESMELGLASCSGLSILLIDACRAVGVPARFAGTPMWVNNSGNHSWVEIWDNGDWHFVGAAEPNPEGMDRGWFVGNASQAIKDDPIHAIYASSFKKTGLTFPNGWSRGGPVVNAINVTDRYTAKARALAADKVIFKIKVLEKSGGERVEARVSLTDEKDPTVKFEGTSKAGTADMNDLLEFKLSKNCQFVVETQFGDKRDRRLVDSGQEKESLLVIDLSTPIASKGDLPVAEKDIARYTAHRTGKPMVIDGKLNEEAWSTAPSSPRFTDLISGGKTLHDTRAIVLWDEQNLYVGYKVEEPFVKAKYQKNNDPIYYDNDVELFIAGRDAYYELEINAFNTTYEAFFIWDDAYEKGGFSAAPEFAKSKLKPFNGVGYTTHPRGKRQGCFDWHFPDKQTAVAIDGTLNNDADRDRGWTVEIALPWKGMEWLAKADGRAFPPKNGDVWRLDFSRFNQYKEAPPAQDSGGWAWSHHGVWDSHIPECFPFITFTTDEVPTQVCPAK